MTHGREWTPGRYIAVLLFIIVVGFIARLLIRIKGH